MIVDLLDNQEIYLDNAATTKPWPDVVDAVTKMMSEGFGNASSPHARGLAAAREVLKAEAAILDLVGCGPWKVIFTSGGTESDVLAIHGSVPKGKRNKFVTTDLEHAAITESAKALVASGNAFVQISGGTRGVINPTDVALAVDDQTALVSVAHAAGEMGTIQPISEIAETVKNKQPRCRLHTDAVQALPQLGRLALCAEVDMLSISAHKIHGPQGIGALLVRPNAVPRPILFGGDQQSGIRPGTFNLPGIVGFGVAARLFAERRDNEIPKMRILCNTLIKGILDTVEGTSTLGDPSARLPGIAVIAFDDIKSEVLLHALEMSGVTASSSSACHSTRKDPPKCLLNAGLRRDQGSVRFSLTFDTTQQEISRAIVAVSEAVKAFRKGRVIK